MNNYRPISIFDKIFEKWVKIQPVGYLDLNNVITYSPYGFTWSNRTVDDLFNLLKLISNILFAEKKTFTRPGKRVFDSVGRNKLLNKLIICH